VDNHEGFARLCIEDNGIGVPSDYAKKAFGIFERLHPAQQYPGTGMGLAIAAKVVERMKGRLGVDPDIVEGSRFWLELPQVSGETIPQISRPGRKREEKLEPNLSANVAVLFSAEG